MYSPDALNLFAAVKHVFDPDNILNPGVRRRPPTARRGPARSRRPARAARPGAGLPPRRRRLHPGGAPLHRGRKVPRRQHRHRRGDVPVVSGDPGGEGLHPRPRPGAAGDDQRHRPSPVAGGRPRCTRRWICACPARGAPRTARPVSTWPRSSPRCCTRATGPQSAPASHYSLGWLPRWARIASQRARSGQRHDARSRASGRWRCRSAGVDKRRTIPPFASQTFRSWFKATETTGPRPATRYCCSWTRSPTTSPPRSGTPQCGCSRPPGTAPQLTDKQQCCGLTWISTGQLDRGEEDPRPHR